VTIRHHSGQLSGSLRYGVNSAQLKDRDKKKNARNFHLKLKKGQKSDERRSRSGIELCAWLSTGQQAEEADWELFSGASGSKRKKEIFSN